MADLAVDWRLLGYGGPVAAFFLPPLHCGHCSCAQKGSTIRLQRMTTRRPGSMPPHSRCFARCWAWHDSRLPLWCGGPCVGILRMLQHFAARTIFLSAEALNTGQVCAGVQALSCRGIAQSCLQADGQPTITGEPVSSTAVDAA